MSIARTPSAITLPATATPFPSILEFLIRAFPHVPADRWAARLRDGKLLDETGIPITADTPYAPARRILYFREVENEPVIPFAEHIVFQNDEILVADKPHFLPVVPGGRYVNECLQQRLRDRTGLARLMPLHRIDRETAGLVLFSVNPETRGRYHSLFSQGKIEKIYRAVAGINAVPSTTHWAVGNRMVRGEPRFRMQVVPGGINARSIIRLVETNGDRAQFELRPLTGKTHQLRVHMCGLGFPIVNDRHYPELQPERADDFTRPLQLLAKAMRFTDPVTGQDMEFCSGRGLAR
jgi:tRNA pseudouridine32 synthase/23S rRNA pseudouridine746 synthase